MQIIWKKIFLKAYAAGLVEGLATAKEIFDFYLNNLCVVNLDLSNFFQK
jgi:hypothetical protein